MMRLWSFAASSTAPCGRASAIWRSTTRRRPATSPTSSHASRAPSSSSPAASPVSVSRPSSTSSSRRRRSGRRAGSRPSARSPCAAAHGAAALPVLTTLAGDEAARGVRRAARRALYRLSQQGVATPAKPPRRLVVERRPERAVRAWLSGIDGTGSRAVWVLFEGGFGGATLCSLIVNDIAGILDVAGGDITKRRLEEELKSLRASQKLPWIAVEPARALRAVVEALTLHATLGTTPPAAFDRWKAPFESARGLHAGAGGPRHGPPDPPAADTPLFERAGELLALPELASWFLDPESVQSDALALLEARDSRLVVSDHIKAQREAASVTP